MKRGLTHIFSRFQILRYSRSLKQLNIASYALRIGVSIMELSGFLITHTFQRMHASVTFLLSVLGVL